MAKEKTKAKASKSAKAAETPAAEPTAKKVSEEDVLKIMRQLGENGITEFTSRLVSDKLGFADADKGRGRVRVLMKKLEADGKVISEKKAVKGKREQYVYKLVK